MPVLSTTAHDIPSDLLATPTPSAPTPSATGVTTPTPAADDLGSRASAVYELMKPRVNFLVLVTTAVGFYAAVGLSGGPRLLTFLNAMLGTALTAAGASVLNQYRERDADALMPRTRRRPLPAGVLSPAFALAFGLSLGVVGTIYLALLVNLLSAALAAFTLATYAFIYTPLKRRTPWCTLIGAVPGAIPPMIGVAAATGTINFLAWALFALMMVWQMPHFFGLATLYRDDYTRGGFRMLPGEPNGTVRTARQVVLYCLLMLPAGLLPIFAEGVGWIYGIASVLLGLWFLQAGLAMARDGGRQTARRLFVVSILYLPLVLFVLVLDRTLPI